MDNKQPPNFKKMECTSASISISATGCTSAPSLFDAIRNCIQSLESLAASKLITFKHLVKFEKKLGMNIMGSRGDGLCFINALTDSILAEFRDDPATLEQWLDNVLMTMMSLDETFMPCLNLLEIKIKYVDGSLATFLDANNQFVFAFARNILLFCIKNYGNPAINIGCERPVDLEVCVGFDRQTGGFRAIDCNMRNFILNIMGIQSVLVYQTQTEPRFQRCADPRNRVSQILKGGRYAGYQIDSFGTVNVGGYICQLLIYSYNGGHYDAVVVHHEGVDKLGLFACVENAVEELPFFGADGKPGQISSSTLPSAASSGGGSSSGGAAAAISSDHPDTSSDAILAKLLEAGLDPELAFGQGF